jgi:hypothetical protein
LPGAKPAKHWSARDTNAGSTPAFFVFTRWLGDRKKRFRAFSSEVDTGSRKENASKQKPRASVLIQSEPKKL